MQDLKNISEPTNLYLLPYSMDTLIKSEVRSDYQHPEHDIVFERLYPTLNCLPSELPGTYYYDKQTDTIIILPIMVADFTVPRLLDGHTDRFVRIESFHSLLENSNHTVNWLMFLRCPICRLISNYFRLSPDHDSARDMALWKPNGSVDPSFVSQLCLLPQVIQEQYALDYVKPMKSLQHFSDAELFRIGCCKDLWLDRNFDPNSIVSNIKYFFVPEPNHIHSTQDFIQSIVDYLDIETHPDLIKEILIDYDMNHYGNDQNNTCVDFFINHNDGKFYIKEMYELDLNFITNIQYVNTDLVCVC